MYKIGFILIIIVLISLLSYNINVEKYVLYDPRKGKRVKIQDKDMLSFCKNKVRVCKKTFFGKGNDNKHYKRYCRSYRTACDRTGSFKEYCKNTKLGSVNRNCKGTKWEHKENVKKLPTKIQIVYIIPGDLNRNSFNNDTNGNIHNIMLKVQKNAINRGDFKFDITDELWTISNMGLEKRNWNEKSYKSIDQDYKFMKCADEMILIKKNGDQTVKMYGRYLVNLKPKNNQISECKFKYDKNEHTDIVVKNYNNHPFQKDNVFYLLIVEDGTAQNCFSAQYMPSGGYYGVDKFAYKFSLFTLGKSANLKNNKYTINGKNCAEYKGMSVESDEFETVTAKITHELMHMTAHTDHKDLNEAQGVYRTDVLYSGNDVLFNNPTFGSYITNERNKGMLSQSFYSDNIDLLPNLSVNKFKKIFPNFKNTSYSF